METYGPVTANSVLGEPETRADEQPALYYPELVSCPSGS